MKGLSEKQLSLELSKLRKAFYLAQAISIFSVVLALLAAAIFGAYVSEGAAIISLIAVFIISAVVSAYLEGEYLVIKCPNCGAYFYSVMKWPFMGWVVFFFFSHCKRCGLNIHGKNIKDYTVRT